MARIRTIKPGFFSSDDVVALSPWARLLFIGLWCEADREGRMRWRPREFKRRYLPDDAVDIYLLCAELLGRGLVVRYGGGEFACIPTFKRHQHINPREAASTLPAPDGVGGDDGSCGPEDTDCYRDGPDSRVHSRVSDAQVGREGKGKEGVIHPPDGGWVGSAAAAPPPAVVDLVPKCPTDAVVALFHEVLPELPQVRVLSERRRRAIAARWRWVLTSRRHGGERRATTQAEGMDWLRRFFERARENDFVMGRRPPGKGHEGWRADLDYLLSERGLLQVVERTDGAGDGGAPPAAPGRERGAA